MAGHGKVSIDADVLAPPAFVPSKK